MRKIILIAGLLFIGWLSVYANSIKLYYAPEKNWMQYKTPEEAGWSVQKLREAHKYFQKVGLSTAMLIYKGKVVVNWGNTNRIFLCHSVRKSFLSTLYGIYATNGDININDTLADINFNDKPPLTKAQQQATIRDLLTCTSGIARDKANPEASFKKVINGKEVIVHYYDKLNSYKPGTHFQYSNWSFNALGGIFNKETKSDLFNDFYNDIAKPIGMQNFSLHQNTFYQYNKYSLFPKYGFLMTTQDMARYGLLYLNNGNWNGKQIISENWVKKSTSTQVKTKDKMDLPFNGYGYLWWTCDSGYFKNHPVYSALGFAGQTINVFPKEDIVIVTHNNTYRLHADNFHYVNNKKTGILLELLLKAKTGSSEKNPALIPLKT
ncbi:MAG TPA: serine hydrolase, partial [Victivallales bacterium]|nr:serine hydrolase [Victivallales bacterium]